MLKGKTKHRHNFKTCSRGNKTVTMRCLCGETLDRPETAAERSRLKKDDGTLRVYHDFVKRFTDIGASFPTSWKLKGYEFMLAVEKWAKRYPDDVRILGCFDSSYMNSYIVLIKHCTTGNWKTSPYYAYHGTTMVLIPQNGQIPCEVFLFPYELTSLIQDLTNIRKAGASLKKLECRRQQYEAKLTRQADRAFVKKLAAKKMT